MGTDHGAKGAVRELAAGAAEQIDQARAAAAGEQLDLIPPSRFEGGRQDEQRRKIEVFHGGRGGEGAGPGRPRGAQNLDTRKMKELLRAHGFDPLMLRWRWAMHTPETLAAELNCTKLEAFDRLDRLWSSLQKLFYADAVPVDDQGRPLPMFTLNFGDGAKVAVVQGPSGYAPPWMQDPEVRRTIEQREQNQRVTIDATPKSNDPQSNEGEKPA